MGGIEKVLEVPVTYLGEHFVAGELSAVKMSFCVPRLVKARGGIEPGTCDAQSLFVIAALRR